jgi:lysophospholipase L1-like esterase
VRTFVVIGDSITAGLSPFNDAEVPGPTSWVPFAEGAPLAFDGGWASPGATTAAMRAGAGVSGADQLVVMGGTNDLLTGLDWTSTRANLVDVVATVGVPDVLLCAIPPLDQQPQARSEFNVRLAELAAEQGWDYVDPWTGVEAAGTFVATASEDGVHPTPEVAAAVGDQIRGQLLLGMQG